VNINVNIKMLKTLDLLILYEEMVRKYHIPQYKISRQSKNFINFKKTFKKLRTILINLDIPPYEYMISQFEERGNRPYPNQLISKQAINRFKNYSNSIDVKGIHEIQESYLKSFIENGYTVEEALGIDIFYYYFRCMKLKNHPKEWNTKVLQEIKRTPKLKNIVKRGIH
jgi:hypothetical protein